MSNSKGSFLGGMGMEEPNIDLSEYQNTKCECGCETFIPTVIFKQIPGLLVGAADQKFVEVPIKVFQCSKCGKLLPSIEKELNKKNDSSTNKKIII